jgi:hypothetical protein
MIRLLVSASLLFVAVTAAGCVDLRDCNDVCLTMRECGMLYGTSKDTCEVTCATSGEDGEDAVDLCGSCAEDTCDPTCTDQCVCALRLDLANYPGTFCTP